MPGSQVLGDFEIDDVGIATGGRVRADPYLEIPSPTDPIPRERDVLALRFGIDIIFDGDFLETGSSDLALTTGLEGFRAVFTRALVTEPGEIHWAPEYGIGIGRFLNQHASAVRLAELRNRIRSSLLQNGDVDEIDRLEVSALADGSVEIELRVLVAGNPQKLGLRIRRSV